MAIESTTDIQNANGTNAPQSAERTRPEPVYTPAVDIFETDQAITVLADMPGVCPQDLTVDLRDSLLTLTGRVTRTEGAGEANVFREYHPGAFVRQFSLAETIDQSRIDARLADGVLRLELPKMEQAKPRRITVRTG